jgi:hypothetical protein
MARSCCGAASRKQHACSRLQHIIVHWDGSNLRSHLRGISRLRHRQSRHLSTGVQQLRAEHRGQLRHLLLSGQAARLCDAHRIALQCHMSASSLA